MARNLKRRYLVSFEGSHFVGRYELVAELARGGMASVHLGRVLGDGGLKRLVAIKRLHGAFLADKDASRMFFDEACVAMRIRHPNVVPALDVISQDDEFFIVMEYLEGASVLDLLRELAPSDTRVPLGIASRILCDVLQGLHAAHETSDPDGRKLGIVHRDVSPTNVLVGADGTARVLDFGVAKFVAQSHITRPGDVKGKLSYMAPEQMAGAPASREADVFSAGVVLWEIVTGRRLFHGKDRSEVVHRLLRSSIPPPSVLNPAVSSELDRVVLRALERAPHARFPTAEEMAAALEHAVPPASSLSVGRWVRATAAETLRQRALLVADVERFKGPAAIDTCSTFARSEPPPAAAPPRRLAPVIVAGVALGVALSALGARSPLRHGATSGAQTRAAAEADAAPPLSSSVASVTKLDVPPGASAEPATRTRRATPATRRARPAATTERATRPGSRH